MTVFSIHDYEFTSNSTVQVDIYSRLEVFWWGSNPCCLFKRSSWRGCWHTALCFWPFLITHYPLKDQLRLQKAVVCEVQRRPTVVESSRYPLKGPYIRKKKRTAVRSILRTTVCIVSAREFKRRMDEVWFMFLSIMLYRKIPDWM